MLNPLLKHFYWSVYVGNESDYYRLQILLNLYAFPLENPFETWETFIGNTRVNFCRIPFTNDVLVWSGILSNIETEFFETIEELAKAFEQRVH